GGADPPVRGRRPRRPAWFGWRGAAVDNRRAGCQPAPQRGGCRWRGAGPGGPARTRGSAPPVWLAAIWLAAGWQVADLQGGCWQAAGGQVAGWQGAGWQGAGELADGRGTRRTAGRRALPGGQWGRWRWRSAPAAGRRRGGRRATAPGGAARGR